MEIPNELSDDIKKEVESKLQNNGVFKNLQNKIKDGIKYAKEEIKTNKQNLNLEKIRNNAFSKKDENERESLNRIYKYLSEHGLSWTLSVLEYETNIQSGLQKAEHKVLERKGYSEVYEITAEEFNANDFIISVKDL